MGDVDLKNLVDSLKAFGEAVSDEILAEAPHKAWGRPDGLSGDASAFGSESSKRYAQLVARAVDDRDEAQTLVDLNELTLEGGLYCFLRSAKSAARLYNRSRIEDLAIGFSEKNGVENGAFDSLYQVDKIVLADVGPRKSD